MCSRECPLVGAEGDCAHCWSDGDDALAGTLQNRRRKHQSRVTPDRSHRTPTIGTCYVGGGCCRRRCGVGDAGNDGNDENGAELCLLADREKQSSRKPDMSSASSGMG